MEMPLITILVVPRERFSMAIESLKSIYENTTVPFELVYVDAGSPAYVRNLLAAQSKEKGFKLIRRNHFLTPNQARKLALGEIKAKYVVFIDNDVVVEKGWLAALLKCAQDTGATLVCPVIGETQPNFEIVHYAGGDAGIIYRTKKGKTGRAVNIHTYQKHIKQHGL